MAILKAGSTAGGSPILTEDTLGNTVYTKTEVDAIVDADVAVVDAKIDSEIAALPNTYYTETEIDTFLDGIGGLNSLPVNVIGDAATNQTLDVSTYSVFQLRPTADITLSTSNLPAAKRSISYIHLLDGGEQTLTFGSEIKWDGGSVPTFSNKVAGDPYSLTGASYLSTFSPTEMGTDEASGISFGNSGTKFYIIRYPTDTLYQYSVSTPWDLSTASYDSKSFYLGATENAPRDVTFNTDGTKMFVVGFGGDEINEYSLSTAWDISTASHTTEFRVFSEVSAAFGLHFKPDGTKVYILDSSGKALYQYSLSTAWDISTASYDNKSYSLGGSSNSRGPYITPDGATMFIVNQNDDLVYQYSLSTAWDISTASYDGISFDISPEVDYSNGITFSDTGDLMYILGGVSFGDLQGRVFTYSSVADVAGQYNLDIISLSQFSTDQVIAKLETSGVEVSV